MSENRRTRFLTCGAAALLLLANAARVMGQPQSDASPEMQAKLSKLVSVDFRNTPIDDVIRVMTRQADLDVVKSPDVTGNITATITDVPLDEALTNILAAHGYAYLLSESMIRVVPRAQVAVEAEKVESKVYRITYADTETVSEAIREFLSDRGELAVNIGTSNILVTDVEHKIRAIDEFLKEVDRITPQILVEVRIYDISSKNRLDLGVNWRIGTNTVLDAAGNAIGGQTNSFEQGSFLGGTSFTETADAALRFGILNSSVDINTIIRLEEEDVGAKLLANPRIMVLDNETANIKIISEVPYQELTETAAGGSIGTTEFKEVGVELNVTPHITRDRMVRLQVRPKFSVQTGEIPISGLTGITSPQPIVDSREATTVNLIKDGQTVVMGGLRKQDVNKQVNKIPVLGDIPLLGRLFRSEGEEIVTSELVVFITPYILEVAPELTEGERHALQATEFDMPHPDDIVIQRKEIEQLRGNKHYLKNHTKSDKPGSDQDGD